MAQKRNPPEITLARDTAESYGDARTVSQVDRMYPRNRSPNFKMSPAGERFWDEKRAELKRSSPDRAKSARSRIKGRNNGR